MISLPINITVQDDKIKTSDKSGGMYTELSRFNSMKIKTDYLPLAFRSALIGLTLLFLLFPSTAAAQRGRFDSAIVRSIERFEASILEVRHQIHANPELGNREFETAALVAAHLRALGFEVQTEVAHTGVIGILRGAQSGPVVAIRADMDALPVTEATDLPFRSVKRTVYNGLEVGVMHACGHDIHTSVQMGVASVLADLREELPGTVMFIFQPAEEGSPPGEEGGAQLMLKEGIFGDLRPSAIFSLHSDPAITVGNIGYAVGPALAAMDHFRISVTGSQTHGASPHLGIDPVVMASQVVMALQTIPSRTIDPLEPCVVTVGMIHGGERFNIIPGTVTLEGTVRTYNPDVRDTIERRMKEIVEGITGAGGGTYSFRYDRGAPATINDPELVRSMVPTLETILGTGHVTEGPPVMAAEDFAYYALEVPGFMYWLGVRKEGTISGSLHSPTMRADDSAVAVGIRAMCNLVLDYLNTEHLQP